MGRGGGQPAAQSSPSPPSPSRSPGGRERETGLAFSGQGRRTVASFWTRHIANGQVRHILTDTHLEEPHKTMYDLRRLTTTYRPGKCLPHFPQKTSLLRELLKPDRDFIWGPEHTEELDGIEAAPTNSPVHAVYNQSKEMKVLTDASKYSLGAALFQKHGHEWR